MADSDDETLACLRAATTSGVLLVIGPAALLPWVDGASYLGRYAAAPLLYLPTALVPNAPLDLLVRAVRRRVPGDAPVALLPFAGGRCELIAVRAGPPLSRKDVDAVLSAPAPAHHEAEPSAGGPT
ncbi:MAG: hypothetical protein HY907_16690 [Deltaproteobacteria bacterium]|nr:hypothetical protein [Deltaproteobacteria bacterium]